MFILYTYIKLVIITKLLFVSYTYIKLVIITKLLFVSYTYIKLVIITKLLFVSYTYIKVCFTVWTTSSIVELHFVNHSIVCSQCQLGMITM